MDPRLRYQRSLTAPPRRFGDPGDGWRSLLLGAPPGLRPPLAP